MIRVRFNELDGEGFELADMNSADYARSILAAISGVPKLLLPEWEAAKAITDAEMERIEISGRVMSAMSIWVEDVTTGEVIKVDFGDKK